MSLRESKTGESEDISKHIFVTPTKMVRNVDDMLLWDKSEAYFEYLGFLYAINDSIKGMSNATGSANASEAVDNVMSILEAISHWIDEIPPVQQPQRFGNVSFREWYNKLKNEAIPLIQSIFPESLYRAVPEIMVYLVEGFGNVTRIDYGTGHELSFVMFLCSLFKIGYLKTEDKPALACKIFVRYMDLVRKLQITYRMEPAGSHGVWSLDDYQFVPFIWGSAQFIGNMKFEPTCFLKESIVNAHARENMFLSCIQYINQVKSGPFAEHSNQLWSISGVSGWSKINAGLMRMYKVEVLGKFPLVQHIYFGSLFTLREIEKGSTTRKTRLSGSGPATGSREGFPTISPIGGISSGSLSLYSVPPASEKSGEGKSNITAEERLLTRCNLKLGIWRESLEGLTEASIPRVLNCYQQATEYDKDWHQAWHAWAHMNFETVLFYKNNEEIDKTQTERAALEPEKNIDLNKHTVLAVQGYFKSIYL
ncbi:hypothetical protein JTB14_029228 [Gonioctena quinquepunctata]|nr:hypothetical protein JTB14_029228 [Gonioctena quinquepunctata]